MNTEDLEQIEWEEPELRDFVIAFVSRFHRLPSLREVEDARFQGQRSPRSVTPDA